MSTHSCDAIVVCCMDFRFQKYIKVWLEENMMNKEYDYVGFAGSTKSLDTIMSQIDISKKLHSIKEVVLIHHEDCGAYGVESSRERHAKDLLIANKTVTDKYSDLKVSMLYLHLDGTFEEIE